MKLTTIFNEEIETPCAGCIVADKTKFVAGRIYQSNLWNISQDFERVWLLYPHCAIFPIMLI